VVDHLSFLKGEVEKLKSQNLLTTLTVLQSKQSNRITINGKEVINFSSNNYLGLANHPRLVKAAHEAIDKWGYGTASVRGICGNMKIHEELEEMLAKFKHTEASLVFVSGIAANRGTIQSIMGEGDVIFSDELNHGSIIDGVRLTKCEKRIYPHLNCDELRKALQDSKNFRRRLVVTDGVFSMDGDIAPLKEIAELAEEFDAIVMVDDAHGDGVMGKEGRGTINHLGVEGKIDIDMGTFSKAFGSLGGYIAGTKSLRDYLITTARSFIFTSSHPPAIVAANMEAIKIVQDEPRRLKTLWNNTKYFKKELQSLGFNTGVSQTPITPVIVGGSDIAQELGKKLLENGVFGKPIVFPLVPKDKARVRTIVTAIHTKDDLNQTLASFEKVGKEMKII